MAISRAGFCLVAATLSAASVGAGCNKVTYRNPALAPTTQVHSETGHFFLAGLVNTKNIDGTALCPGGVAWVQSKNTVGDVLLTLITGFIYTPRTYEIACGTRGAQ